MDDADEKSFQQALNMMIVVLNWLHLGQPRRLPRDTSMHQVVASKAAALSL